MVYYLDESITFPDPFLGDEDGLLAIGGDLSQNRLLLAYSYGIFPWFGFRDSPVPMWYCPLNRFVIVPEDVHISHSMRTLMNKGLYTMTINQDFKGVIEACSSVNGRYDVPGAWLGEDMIKAYTQLHKASYAASVEVWDQAHQLVGGLYGVTMGHCFMGESMFSHVPNGSKLALIYLAQYLQDAGGKYIDCQFETPHLRSMGGRYIPYYELIKWVCPDSYQDLMEHWQDDYVNGFDGMNETAVKQIKEMIGLK